MAGATVRSSGIASRQILFSVALVTLYLLLSILWQDLSFYDESVYMDLGTQVHAQTFLHSIASAPLYALWYRAIAVVVHDPISPLCGASVLSSIDHDGVRL